MRKKIQSIATCTALAMLALPALANRIPMRPDVTAQDQCTDENKAAWYQRFTETRTGDTAKAYEAGKKYLTACPKEDDQIATYLKRWVAAYEKEARKIKFPQLLYSDKKYAEAYALGREILAEDPDNLKVLIDLGYGGYLATTLSKNESFNSDSIGFAKKAIQLIESGKAPEGWAPFTSKDDALSYLYYTIGFLNIKSNPSEALGSLIRAAQFESNIKKTPSTYYLIAAAYEAGPYAKQSADYKAAFEGKDETPQSKLALENINQIIDRMVDAYARAVAIAGSEAKYQTQKTDWMSSLTDWYKFRHNKSDEGLNEVIAGILAKPLPPEPTPLTSLPTPPVTTAPGTSTGSSSVSAAAGSEPAPQPAKAQTGKTTTTPSSASKTTPPNKPRRAHARH